MESEGGGDVVVHVGHMVRFEGEICGGGGGCGGGEGHGGGGGGGEERRVLSDGVWVRM